VTRVQRYVLIAICVLAACGRRPAIDPPAPAAPNAATETTAEAPRTLPPSAMKLEWTTPVLPPHIEPGKTFPLAVEVKNVGDETWPASDSSPAYKNGAYAVRISHRWCGDRGIDCPGFLTRFNLTKSLPPGEKQTINITIEAPAKPGWYELQFDAVQELVGWFSGQGLEQMRMRVRVG
jgi:hypothetical protein